MQHLEVSCAVRRIYRSLGFKRLKKRYATARGLRTACVCVYTDFASGKQVPPLPQQKTRLIENFSFLSPSVYVTIHAGQGY